MSQKRAQKHCRQNIMLWGGIAVVTMIVVGIFVLNFRSKRPVGEEASLRSQGNTHIADNTFSAIEYNSTPPTSGPHYSSIASWRIYEEPLPYERVVHNLEDGGVAIYYQCEDGCPELIGQLTQVVESALNRGKHVLMLPNDPNYVTSTGNVLHNEMESRIALAAWQRLDTFDEFDADRIAAFIDRYEGIDHHQ